MSEHTTEEKMDEASPSAGPSLVVPPSELCPDGVDITAEKDGGVLKQIKVEGKGDGGPCAGDKVVVHYTGTLADGTKFDSSRDRNDKFEFTLGQGSVIKSWDLGVATMKKGEVCVLTCRGDYAYGARGSPPKIPPNATLIFEVELFEWKGEDISADSDGSIRRSYIHKGAEDSSPSDGANVKVHIIGRCGGEVFEDRSVDFAMGEGADQGIVDGVEEALSKFNKGERSRVTMDARHAYGSAGCPEKNVPGNCQVEYEIELIEFEKVKESWEMEPNEKIEQSEIAKAKGTKYFKSANYTQAVKFYAKIVDYLDAEEPLEGDLSDKQNALLLAAHLNLAQCHLKLNENFDVCKECDKALELDDNCEKAYFRRAQAKYILKDYEDCIVDYTKVLEIDGKNKAAKNQISLAQRKIKAEKDKAKQIYGGMFEKFAKIDSTKQKDEPIPPPPPAESLDEGKTVQNGASETDPTPEPETKDAAESCMEVGDAAVSEDIADVGVGQ